MRLLSGRRMGNINAGISVSRHTTGTIRAVRASIHCPDLHVAETNRTLAFNSATDLYLAVFSTYIFWNLNLKLRIKFGLVALLGLGIL
jgi:hypothetical protein